MTETPPVGATPPECEAAAEEQLLWTGRPGGGVRLRRGDGCLIPFSLVWCGFACVWEWLAVRSGSVLLSVLGVPFVLLGLYIFVGRFLHDAWKRRDTLYGVTEREIFIAQDRPGGRVRRIAVADLIDLELDERGDGRGTLRFGLTHEQMRSRDAVKFVASQDFAFINIENAREVYELIEGLR